MKNFYKTNLLNKLYLFIALASFTTSCSKNESNKIESEDSYVDISVGGYIEPTILETREASSPVNKAAGLSASRQVVEDQDIFSRILLQENSIESKSKSGKLAVAIPVTPTVKLTKMASNTKYLVLVFDDENHIVGDPVLSTVGEKTRINIPSRYRSNAVDYTVVAFTYNSDQESDFDTFLNGAIGDNPQIDIPTDREFFYSHTTVSMDFTLSNPKAGGYQHSIELQFQPQTAKVGVVLDAMGSNAKVVSSTGYISSEDITNQVQVNTAKLNLRINTITDFRRKAQDGSFNLVSTDANGADSLAHYIYTVVNPADPNINKFKVKFDNITVMRSDGVSSSISNQTYYFNNITSLAKGKKINARMYLFEGFAVGNVLWSSANLYYTSIADRKYKFRNDALDGREALTTDYWAYKRLIPFSLSTAADEVGDPCSKVYPYGWRLPTQADMGNLTAIAPAYTMHSALVKVATYTSGNKKLTFATNGYYTEPQKYIYETSSTGRIGVYWVDSDQNSASGDDRNVLTFTVWGNNTIRGRNDFSFYTPNHSFANIRCVRDAR